MSHYVVISSLSYLVCITLKRSKNLKQLGLVYTIFICFKDNEFHRVVIILKAAYVVTNGQDEGSYIILKTAVFLIPSSRTGPGKD